MNFIRDFHPKYACCINQIKLGGFIPSRSYMTGLMMQRNVYTARPRLNGRVCPIAWMLQGFPIITDYDNDIALMFMDGYEPQAGYNNRLAIEPFLMGYCNETSYSDRSYPTEIGKFAFNLGRYYMGRYFDMPMKFNGDLLRKHGIQDVA